MLFNRGKVTSSREVRRCCANLLAPGRATEFHESKILRVETSTSSDLCSAILPLAMLAVLSPAEFSESCCIDGLGRYGMVRLMGFRRWGLGALCARFPKSELNHRFTVLPGGSRQAHAPDV